MTIMFMTTMSVTIMSVTAMSMTTMSVTAMSMTAMSIYKCWTAQYHYQWTQPVKQERHFNQLTKVVLYIRTHGLQDYQALRDLSLVPSIERINLPTKFNIKGVN